MFKGYGTGIKLLKDTGNGQFKELNVKESTDSTGKKHYIITICMN